MIAAGFVTHAAGLFHKRPNEDVVDWAEGNVYLSSRVAEKPGKFSVRGREYMREPLNQFADRKVKKMSLCWGSQNGKTTLVYTGTGWIVDQKPRPILSVWPSDKLARNFSKKRLIPFFEDSAALDRHLPKDSKGETDEDKATGLSIEFDKCDMILTGGQSSPNVKNVPVTILISDEVDEIEDDISNEADERVKGRVEYKIFRTSTPTIKTGRIWREYLEGDQRHYFITCPHCGEEIDLQWTTKDENGNTVYRVQCDKEKARKDGQWIWSQVVRTAFYSCQCCGGEITNRDKRRAIRSGRWIPKNPDAPEGWHSYHLSTLYSPTRSFGDMLQAWLMAQGDVSKLKLFVQGWLAQPFSDDLLEIDKSRIEKITGTWQRGDKKGDFRILVADAQRHSFWWVVRGVDANGQTYLIDNGNCATFDELDQIFTEYDCRAAGVDTGDGGRTAELYEEVFYRRASWFAIKGEGKMATPYKYVQIDPFSGLSRAGRHKIRLLHVNKSIWQAELARRRAGKVADWGLYENPDPGYLEQLNAVWLEETRSKKTGKLVKEWKTRGTAGEHYWDCETYALAMSRLLGAAIFPPSQRDKGDKPKEGETDNSNQEQTNPKPTRRPRHPGRRNLWKN